jgi:hypothetical protein
MALMAGLLVMPAFLVGCPDQAAKRSSMDNNVKNAKLILEDLKKTFATGQMIQTGDARSGERDNRFGLLVMLVNQKIVFMINKRVTDPAQRAPLQAKMVETSGFIENTLVPKYNEALASRKPEDAKALVPLMDQLDKRLDEVSNMLP